MKNKNITYMTQAAMIAAIYVVITYVGAAFSFGEVQVRISEALTILPVFTPAAVPGLFVGCLIGNILGGAILPDIIFGSLATLIGAFFTWKLRNQNRILAPLPPIIANIIVVPFVLRYGYGGYRRSDFLWYTRTDPCICAGQIQTYRISKCINKIECALAHSRAERVAERL